MTFIELYFITEALQHFFPLVLYILNRILILARCTCVVVDKVMATARGYSSQNTAVNRIEEG